MTLLLPSQYYNIIMCDRLGFWILAKCIGSEVARNGFGTNSYWFYTVRLFWNRCSTCLQRSDWVTIIKPSFCTWKPYGIIIILYASEIENYGTFKIAFGMNNNMIWKKKKKHSYFRYLKECKYRYIFFKLLWKKKKCTVITFVNCMVILVICF